METDVLHSHHGNEITSAQRLALSSSLQYNLTDGHPRRAPLPNEQEVINRLPEFFTLANDLSIPEVEQGLFAEYAQFSGQTIRPEVSFVFPSASNALICAAMVLRQSVPERKRDNLEAGVITPIFDNIPGIFQSVGVAVDAIAEHDFKDETALEARVADKDALLLVSPNNPTGFVLSEKQLRTVAAICNAAGTILVVDSCFRMYKSEAQFDTTKALDDTGVSYALINDTGKLWALHENKAGILSVSENLRRPAKTAHDIMQLSSSVTNMLMLTELMSTGGDTEAIMQLVRTNRTALKEALTGNENAALMYPAQETGLPLELLEFSQKVHHLNGKRSSPLGAALLAHVSRVITLPMTSFMFDFEHGKSIDPAMTRVSLSRSQEHFAEAAKNLGQVTSGQLMQVLYDRYL